VDENVHIANVIRRCAFDKIGRKGGMGKRLIVLLMILVGAGTTLVGVWQWSYGEALGKLQSRGQGSLALASDRLVSQLERFRQLPVVLSSATDWGKFLGGEEPVDTVNRQLEKFADMTGARDILLLDVNGTIKAAADWREDGVDIGKNISRRPDFVRALHGALGFYHARSETGVARGFYFTSAVRDSDRTIIGALSVEVDLESLEGTWRANPEIIFFTDTNDIIFIANRDSLILRGLSMTPPETVPAVTKRYGLQKIEPMPVRQEIERGNATIWRMSDSGELPAYGLYMQKPLPVIGMTGNILLDLSIVDQEARLRTALAAAFMSMILLVVLVLVQRRHSLAVRLLVEEAANNRLEDRVEARTAELRRTESELVQAAKLSALGQMSAGIAHELNQPLAAIQSYAENAVILLERGQTGHTESNLRRISELATRMGRIITNLRAFARKEGEAIGTVDLARVVEDTLELAAIRLRDQNVAINWQTPEHAVLVSGGRVRLQQVVLNLISNATDAMGGLPVRKISIAIEETPKLVYLVVRDTGPGLSAPEKIFEPFYSTKTVGDSMGLGLSISYGIVQSFGGRITGVNHPDGGAEFRMELTRIVDSEEKAQNDK